MRKLFILVIMLAASVAVGQVVKSSLAMRHLQYEGNGNEDWGDFYVTNGLIAMWDGEWNVGIGEHDDSTTVWVDLSGNGNDLEIYNSYCHWEDKCLRSNTTRSNKLYAKADMAFSYETCEFVVERIEYPGLVSFSGIGDYRMFEYDKNYVQFISPYTEIVDGIDFPSKASCQCVYLDGDSIKAWINGLPMVRGTARSSWLWAGRSQDFGIGGGGSYPLYQMTGRIFSVRLYSRKLSEKELAHNLALDMERFGLQ